MRVIALYATRLALRGHNVTVILPRSRSDLRKRFVGLIKTGAWIGRRPLPESHFENAPFRTIRLAHSGPITDRDVPNGDVVVATWWETAEWVWKLSREKGAKCHFMQDYETWGALDTSRVDAVCALPLPKIVIAKWVWELLETKWGQIPIALIPNSVDPEKFFAPPRQKQTVPTVGFTYSTLRNKGCDTTIASIDLAKQTIPELRAIAFGPQPPAAGFGEGTLTEFHVAVPEEKLRSLYASCDAWLFGTRLEGFGLPILEAMACRTPVVGTPAGAGLDLISKGGGILVPIDDASAMAEGIIAIARMSPVEWLQMSELAYNTATSYSWEDATDMFENALEGVAEGEYSGLAF